MLDVKISKRAYQDYFKAFEWYEEHPHKTNGHAVFMTDSLHQHN